MMTSLGKLQKENDSLNKKILEYRDRLAVRNEELGFLKLKYLTLEKKYNELEKTIDEKIAKAIEIVVRDFIEQIDKLTTENERLKSLLNLDSSNSGLSTSKTAINSDKRIPNSREKSNKPLGGQIGHKKSKLERFDDEEATDIEVHSVEICLCGCSKLSDIGIRTTKQSIDLDIQIKKIIHEFHNYKCSSCGKVIKSSIPVGLKEDIQYGSSVKSMVVSLINEGCVSINRTKKLISGFSNNEINLSEGYIAKLQKECASKLEEFEKELKVKVLNEKLIHWDDTVISINKKRGCLRFYGTKKLALYAAHKRKNREGLDEDAILQNLPKETIVVHDHNSINYNSDYIFQNSECCVHLLREVKKINDVLPREWLNELATLISETNDKRNEYIVNDRTSFEDEFIIEMFNKYDELVLKGKIINEEDYNKYHGHLERTFIKRLTKYKTNYLMWVVDFDVPFDNNEAERSLRHSKTKMKVSGHFQNIENARYFAIIRSYIETCKRNGINPHLAIYRLYDGNPYTIEEIFETTQS